jgi:manganese efflux pump family protein
MSPFSIAVLAFGMSIDALIVSVGRGAVRTPRLGEAVRAGFVFGAVEATTPLVGWFAGMAAARYVAAIDHWIAFALLGAVGGQMLLQALRNDAAEAVAGGRTSLVALLATAFGTSIDAMAVGVSLALLDVDIVIIAAAIGATTFVMSTGGMIFGSLIGQRFGRWAGGFGGIALIALGTSILGEHLSWI